MQNSWPTWILPFGMIGFWLVAAVVELVRTPKPSNEMNIHRQS